MTSINNYGYKTKLGVIKIMERTLPDGKVFEIIEITPKPTITAHLNGEPTQKFHTTVTLYPPT